jgi:IS1 family transposase
MAGVSINTVTKLLVDAGNACAQYQHDALRNLPCRRLQLDEIWSFCYCKQKIVSPERAGIFGYGDVWTWTAIDAETKLVPSWLVAARDAGCAKAFVLDLAGRLASRVQLTSDGLKVYLQPVEDAFAGEVNYAMLIKMYGNEGGNSRPETRYSPGECCGVRTETISGDPEPDYISTSFVERQNLTMRMRMRRFTRLTNAFSKKVENLEHAVAVHFMHYNFVRRHMTLKTTPAIKAGVTDRLWTLEDMIRLIDDELPN